jgi:hypothetical protein
MSERGRGIVRGRIVYMRILAQQEDRCLVVNRCPPTTLMLNPTFKVWSIRLLWACVLLQISELEKQLATSANANDAGGGGGGATLLERELEQCVL